MSNLSFKNPFEMSHDELLSYIGDLEKRIANANNGAAIFRSEANLNRTEMLKYKEIAGQAEERTVTAILEVEKHLEMIIRMLQRTGDVAHAWHEYDLLMRFIIGFTQDALRNWREDYLSAEPQPHDSPAVDDIPF